LNLWIRNWSHIATHLVAVLLVLVACWGDALQRKPYRLGMKFGRIVLQAN